MNFNWKKWTRKTHYWGAIVIALPVVIVIGTGVLLQLKKQSDWIQPPTARGSAPAPSLSFDRILEIARTVPEAGVASWSDIDRLDVRPERGVVKIRSRDRWEIQLDHATGEILQVAVRRSDLIESIHDGSFFHEKAKLWIFLPSAVVLLLLWTTGTVLFLIPYQIRATAARKREAIHGQRRAAS